MRFASNKQQGNHRLHRGNRRGGNHGGTVSQDGYQDDPTTRDFFQSSNFLTILPHDSEIFDHAARMRAEDRLRFVDVIHVATATSAACKYFITNDNAIRTRSGLAVVQLDTLLP
ncbi:type II toxin-antitoxin system VapC family toxin [Duganella phyllosphaerae]|uniref:type II toxin-antitoxin system VapC family toxin n=1 Tax=Duganella phyllosphaerae TaxID=762836 RepID=UPI0008FC98F0